MNSMAKFEQPFNGGRVYDIGVSIEIDPQDQGLSIELVPERNSVLVKIDNFGGFLHGFCEFNSWWLTISGDKYSLKA